MFKQYKLKNYRFRLIAYVVILCIIGVMVVGSAKPSVQNKQIVGLIGGLIAMVIISLIDYNTILKFRRPIYLLAVVLLAVIFIPGVGDNTGGATRWIQVTSSFKFQPSEFCKILLIVFFAGFFMKYICFQQRHLNFFQGSFHICLCQPALAAQVFKYILQFFG